MSHGAGTVNSLLNNCNKVSVSKAKRGIEKGEILMEVRSEANLIVHKKYDGGKYQQGKESPNKQTQNHLSERGRVKNPIYDFPCVKE